MIRTEVVGDRYILVPVTSEDAGIASEAWDTRLDRSVIVRFVDHAQTPTTSTDTEAELVVDGGVHEGRPYTVVQRRDLRGVEGGLRAAISQRMAKRGRLVGVDALATTRAFTAMRESGGPHGRYGTITRRRASLAAVVVGLAAAGALAITVLAAALPWTPATGPTDVDAADVADLVPAGHDVRPPVMDSPATPRLTARVPRTDPPTPVRPAWAVAGGSAGASGGASGHGGPDGHGSARKLGAERDRDAAKAAKHAEKQQREYAKEREKRQRDHGGKRH